MSESSESELDLLTFEEFKNEISEKNDKIKNQSEMWWIALKNNLLYNANYSIQDSSADIVNVLATLMVRTIARIINVNSFDDKLLIQLNNDTIKLKRVSKKDILEFLTILLKYVKSTKYYDNVVQKRFERDLRRVVNPEVGYISNIIEDFSREDDPRLQPVMKDIYSNLLDGVKLIEFVVSKIYSREFGNIEDRPEDCNTLFHSITEYYEDESDGDFKRKGQIFKDLRIFKELKEKIEELKGELKSLVKERDTIESYKRKTIMDLRKDDALELRKQIDIYTDNIDNVINPNIKEIEEELLKLTNEIDNITPNYYIHKSNINEKYQDIQQIMFQYIIPNSEGMDEILNLDRENLIRDLKLISKLFEEIIIISLFLKDEVDEEKIIDQCMVKEIEIYSTLLKAFIGDYKTLKEYNDDEDGRKSKGYGNIYDYDYIDIIVCLDKYIIKSKQKLLSVKEKTKLTFLYQDAEKDLLQDSDEELDDINQRLNLVKGDLEYARKGLFDVEYLPQDYFKTNDYVIFRETKKEEMPWFKKDWSHFNPTNDLGQQKDESPPDTPLPTRYFYSRIKERIKKESKRLDESSDDEISDEEDEFKLLNYIETSLIDDCTRDRAYFGTGKVVKVLKHPQNESLVLCIIKWKRGYYPIDELYEYDKNAKSYQTLFIVKPITCVKKISDLIKYDQIETKVKYNDWPSDKILIDYARRYGGIYGSEDIFPWPTGRNNIGPSFFITNESLMELVPWDIYDPETGPITLGKSVRQLENVLANENQYSLFSKEDENRLIDNKEILSLFLDDVLDEIYADYYDFHRDKVVKEEVFKNLNHRIDDNPYEAIIDMFAIIPNQIPQLKSIDNKQTSTITKVNTEKDNYFNGGIGRLIEIRTPTEWPFNNLSYSIAIIEVIKKGRGAEQKFLVQRLLRHLDIDYSKGFIEGKKEQLQKLTEIKDEYEDRMDFGDPTQYIENPYRKNKDIYNRKLKELGMGDIYDRMILQQKTNFKDKEIKMLEFTAEQAKIRSVNREEQAISLAPEYLKWMKYVQMTQEKGATYDRGGDKFVNEEYGVGPEESDDREIKTVIEQPDVIELEYLDSLGLDKQSVLNNPRLITDRSQKQYDMSLGPKFRGNQSLRRDILSRRVPSDESSESRTRRTGRMNRLVNTIDRERDIRRRNIESYSMAQMRANDEAAARIQALYRGNRTRSNLQ